MKSAVRIAAMFMAVMFSSAFPSTAQQSDSQKPSASKKPAPAQSSEKSAEPTPKPETPQEAKPAIREASPDKDKDKEERYDMSEVPPVVTHHQVTVEGKPLKYTATAGRLPIKRGDGKIEAEMFYVAYTLDGQDAAKRPMTFAFNGGPGSASIWLHMGALGPRKVVLQPDGFMPPAPYHIEDNPHTLLDKTDLVLIDAIGTGFSRAADQEMFKKFWGVKGDIEAFSEFIRLYISRNERWSSPLFILGESYGTTRAAGIAGYLADRGISFNGITLAIDSLEFPVAGRQLHKRSALHLPGPVVHHDRRIPPQARRRSRAGYESRPRAGRKMGIHRI